MWENHADPEIRRVSKPVPEPVYPAYVVSESDKGVDDLRVAMVATPQPTPDQMEILFSSTVGECSCSDAGPSSGGGGGGGFATRINSKLRPQDPGGGGGATRITGEELL